MADSSIAINLRGISKSFGAVQANKNVNFSVPKGTIHGIVGENGAGKSTLMSILYGFYEADSGEIYIDGKETQIHNSTDAINAGIGMVHQHFMLVDNFTALENIMLGAESGMVLAKSISHAEIELEKLESEFGLWVDLHAQTEALPVGQQQRIEILKALYRGAKILILDEPTGVLTPQEADQLFSILRSLKNRGTTVIIITHKLREIIDLTDNVSVMRQGEIVANLKTLDTNQEELAELMVGRKIRMDLNKKPSDPKEVLLTVKDLSFTDNQDIQRLDSISFNVHAGEIVGIAGISGNGQSELLEILSGMRHCTEGQIIINNKEISPTDETDAQKVRQYSVGHVPEDRLKRGLISAFMTNESSILGYHKHSKFNNIILTNPSAIKKHCLHLMESFDVRPKDPSLKSANFSGGNQQKLILAREMDPKPKVLLVGQPTRGVDIGAIEFIHKHIIDMRDNGSAVLLVSGELDELISLADRILVMFEGKIVGEIEASIADEKTLGLMMANAHTQESTIEQAI
ncbi:MAG: ABC transporter ATP-binding protein [Sulfurovum sp.]|nr:ABC transporter ATP-binding protein [Sulfurovum sp.]